MVSNQGIRSNKWLLPLIAVSIAVMALAFWAMMGNKTQASHEPGHGSAKEGSRTSDLNVLGGGDVGGAAVGDWIHLSELDVAIHTSNKTLYTDVSLECGLSTKTKVKSKNGVADTSIASSSVEVKVLIDGVRAEPGVVNCCRRTQELTAEFQGLIDGCMTVDEFNNVIIDPDCVTPETLELILEPVCNLFRISAAKASTTICRLVFSFLSQFFQSRRHFSSQAKDRSTTHRFGSTTKVCISLRFTTSTDAPSRLCTPAAKGSPV